MSPGKFAPHVLVMIDGQSLTGRATPTTFTITGPDGTFKIPAKKISSITFERGSPSSMDEVLMKSTSRIRGQLAPDPLPFEVEDTGQTMRFAHNRLHTLVMFFDR